MKTKQIRLSFTKRLGWDSKHTFISSNRYVHKPDTLYLCASSLVEYFGVDDMRRGTEVDIVIQNKKVDGAYRIEIISTRLGGSIKVYGDGWTGYEFIDDLGEWEKLLTKAGINPSKFYVWIEA